MVNGKFTQKIQDHDDDEELKDRIKRTGNKFKDRKN